jgi:hypothetical protein
MRGLAKGNWRERSLFYIPDKINVGAAPTSATAGDAATIVPFGFHNVGFETLSAVLIADLGIFESRG